MILICVIAYLVIGISLSTLLFLFTNSLQQAFQSSTGLTWSSVPLFVLVALFWPLAIVGALIASFLGR